MITPESYNFFIELSLDIPPPGLELPPQRESSCGRPLGVSRRVWLVRWLWRTLMTSGWGFPPPSPRSRRVHACTARIVLRIFHGLSRFLLFGRGARRGGGADGCYRVLWRKIWKGDNAFTAFLSLILGVLSNQFWCSRIQPNLRSCIQPNLHSRIQLNLGSHIQPSFWNHWGPVYLIPFSFCLPVKACYIKKSET